MLDRLLHIGVLEHLARACLVVADAFEAGVVILDLKDRFGGLHFLLAWLFVAIIAVASASASTTAAAFFGFAFGVSLGGLDRLNDDIDTGFGKRFGKFLNGLHLLFTLDTAAVDLLVGLALRFLG